ncbi:hypothetical protein IWT25_00705 [Secundilactobacillus pentosiphilus]|uniref:Uncharacterized protein n=1 Tax=Secundilactobacillus pentosiphilus TaxID=1714682 RepID=A0A1Z5IVD3_9LACO|nr:hypothetical protein [Secundilactobacillus pentosiphilus]GAX05401.1 hypothetical protein IWT25_00705 [Secundilactobacillus pentosiphilus]
MKIKHYVMLGLAIISLGTGLSVKGETAQAVQDEWRNAHWVTLTKNVTVEKIHVVEPMYKSRSVNSYTAKRGQHFKMEHWGTDYSWVLQSGRFNSGGKYLYVVDASYKGGWFKMGTHKVTTKRSSAKYKAFHGYRIATSKSDISYNTFYSKSNHATLSDYRPTQTSKVIFSYGSHVYPKSHEWTWFHGKGQNLLTDYRYVGGKWVKKDTTDVSKI